MKKVWLMCGPAGSGKSTWVIERILDTDYWASRDAVRFSLLGDNDNYFSKEKEVFNTWIKNIQNALEDDKIKNIFIDATHLNKRSRDKVLNRLDCSNVELCAVNFDISLEETLRRNSLREGRAKVPDDVIKNMYNSFSPATLEEGFSAIYWVTEEGR